MVNFKWIASYEFKKITIFKHQLRKKREEFYQGSLKRRIQSEIESYNNLEDEYKEDSIQVQDILMQNTISI